MKIGDLVDVTLSRLSGGSLGLSQKGRVGNELFTPGGGRRLPLALPMRTQVLQQATELVLEIAS